jgi:FkbM family methyltransferase
MNKLFEFRRLNFRLAIKLAIVYVRRALKFKPGKSDVIYQSYLHTLTRSNFRHIRENNDCFEVGNKKGVRLFVRKYPSSDSQVLYQIWKENEYEVVADYISTHFKNHNLRIVDAGANVGYASLFLHHSLKDQFELQFVIVEPGEDNLMWLKRNFELNGLTGYQIEKAGLFNKSCYLIIKKDFRDGRDWSLRVEESTQATDLKAIEISEILYKNEWDYIDFFKMDIEGSEKYLFEEPAYARNFLEKIKLISIEIHDEMDSRNLILKSFSDNNLKYFSHGELTVGRNLNFNLNNN